MANATKKPASDKADKLARLAALEQAVAGIEANATPDKVDKSLTPGKVFAAAKTEAETAVERRFGFKSFSEYCGAVRKACTPGGGDHDKRLYTKAVTGMGEGTGADGGFLVPPEFSKNIFQRVYENDLLSRTDKYTCSGNTMVFPAIDETSRADGSRFGGVRGYWLDEAAQITRSAPKFRRIQMVLQKLAALAYVTDELLSDSSVALDQYLTKLFAMEIEFQVGAAIVRGDGVGKPLGLLNAGCTVSVSKETGQAAATIVFENITKMFQRMWGPSKANAVWLVNPDTANQLYALSLGIGTAGVAAYLPPGGLSANPYATLMGRPVLEQEFCSTLGTVGDIILVDLSQYITLSKGSVDNEMSIHLRFDYDEMAYRCIFRVAGQPWWHAALTPYQGSNTLSPIITLATRA